MASNEPEMGADDDPDTIEGTACLTAGRTARSAAIDKCGTRQQKVNMTAWDMGIIGPDEMFTPDVNALLTGGVDGADNARAALAVVWFDNPETGEALYDQHGGDFSSALAEAWSVVDGLGDDLDVETAEDDEDGDVESVEVQPIDDEDGDGAEDVDGDEMVPVDDFADEGDDDAPSSDEIDEEEDFVPLDDVDGGEDEDVDADAGEESGGDEGDEAEADAEGAADADDSEAGEGGEGGADAEDDDDE